MAILPIPTTRSSDYLSRTRLVQQVQSDQLALFRLQQQLSTGRRIFLPSDDAASAQRAITLQRNIERKGQLQTNVDDTLRGLSASETAVGNVTNILTDVRAQVLGVIGTDASDAERLATVQTIDQAIDSLLGYGNSRYQDTFLFGGTRSLQAPYAAEGTWVQYSGNEVNLRTEVDLGQYFDTTISGAEVFGGLSDAVRGTGDLNPHVTPATFLSQLNGGQGISPDGAVTVSYVPDGVASVTESAVIDISSAHTLGDVARLIEEQAPAIAQVKVDVTGSGLTVRAGVGKLIIEEVGDGRTAAELGIDQPSAAATRVGDDINPTIRRTTPLADLLGSKASARLGFTTENNDIVLTAKANGAASNGVTVIVQAGAASGSETVAYNASAAPPELVVTIASGTTTAQDVVDLINADGSLPFAARVDFRDAESPALAGAGVLSPTTFTAVTAGGAGTTLDLASGLRIRNGDTEAVIPTSDLVTVEDLLNRLNDPQYGLIASINESASGFDIRTRRSGADFSIAENGGALATQLGVRTYTTSTRLSEFNRGVGVTTDTDKLLQLSVTSGATTNTFAVDLSSVTTVSQLFTAISTATAGAVTGSLATTGNGFTLTAATSGATVAVSGGVAERLGFFEEGANGASGVTTLAAADRRTLGVDSVFDTLIRLREALADNKTHVVGEELARLDTSLERVTFARAELGSRLKSLSVLQTRLEDEDVTLKGALSNEVDADLVQTISDFTARQYSLQASLQTTAQVLQLTLLDFL